MKVDPEMAGRITELSFDGANLLATKEQHAENWGSTYWTSPQADWGWPPVAAVDADAYELGRVEDGSAKEHFILVGPEANIGPRKFRVEKEFRPGSLEGTLDVLYSIHNVGEASFEMANWEIMRVPSGGVTFFPTGKAELTPIAPHDAMPTEKAAGATFFDHRKFSIGKCQKLHADGEGGYLAHATPDALILKLFVDTNPEQQAPGEGECEIFSNEDGKYVEVEVQGAYSTIAPGEKLTLVVRTVVVPWPAPVDLDDRAALRRFADEQAKIFSEGL